MKESTSKEKVLKNIRNALINKTETPYPHLDCESSVYAYKDEAPEVIFAEAFTNMMGKFVFCESTEELLSNLKALIEENKWQNVFCKEEELENLFKNENISFTSEDEDFLKAEASITTCEHLVARLGSIVVSSKQIPGRKTVVFPPVHIVIAYQSQVVIDIKDAIISLKLKYGNEMPSLISIITGPSRTADIEKTLVMGAHGPKDLYCFLIDDSGN